MGPRTAGVAAAVVALLGLAGADPVLDLMVERVKAQAVVQPQDVAAWDANIDYCLSVLKPDFSFSDIDYSYQQPAIWPAYNHTKRAEWFASAWISPASKYYQDASFLGTTLKVFDWWLVNGPASKQNNWWWWTIGVPISLGITSNILAPHLAPNQTAAAAGQLLKANPAGYTACNLIWTCEGTVYRGLLTGNATVVGHALNLSYATITYATGTGEGIRSDGSFFQHGPQLYSGGYGMSYAMGIAMFLSWTAGTPLGIPDDDPRMAVFSRLMLDGSLRMIRYSSSPPSTPSPEGAAYAPGLWDISVIGRDISRPYGSNWGMQAGVQVQFTPAMIAGVGGPRADEFAGYGALLNGSATPAQRLNLTVGSTVYAQADYVLHSSPVGTYATPDNGGVLGWQAGVRMASTRGLRCECINGENKKGLHLSDGPLFLTVDGYEYVDSFPVWDWMRLPGTTVLPYAVPWSCGGSGTTSFVGGAAVSSAALASAVQDYKAADSEGLTLRKSVFFYPGLYVALGANITAASNRQAFVAWTGIAQRKLTATGIFTSASASSPLPAGTNTSLPATTWWVWEGGVGYVFPAAYAAAAPSSSSSLRGTSSTSAAPAPVLHVSNVVSTGKWEDIGAMSGTVSMALFTLWLEHPSPVVNASYAYLVLPNIPLAQFITAATTLVSQPVAGGGLQVVRNDGNAQAVLHGGQQALQAAVFALDSPTSSTLNGGPGWTVSVTSAGAYIVQAASTGSGEGQGQASAGTATTLSFTAAAPSQPGKPWSVTVGIDRSLQPGPAGGGAGAAGGVCSAGGLQWTAAPGDGTSATGACTGA